MHKLQKMWTGFTSGSHFKFFPLFFLLLLFCNHGVLFYPPQWDEILGLHNQALFLAGHNFSFSQLWAPGQHSFEGSNVYQYGVLPVLHAIWYTFFSPKTVHLLGHLLNMICMAGAAAFLSSILRNRNVSAGCAFGWGIAALTEPLLYSQTLSLGQEPPLILATVAVLWLAQRERWRAMMILAFLAVFLKTSAAVLTFALFLWLLLRLSADRTQWKTLRIPLAGLFVIVLFQLFLLQHNVNIAGGGIHTSGAAAADGSRSLPIYFLRKAWFHAELYFPVLSLIFCAGGAAWGIRTVRQRKMDWFCAVLFLVCAGYAGAYLIARTALPRYMAVAVIPAILLLALNWNPRPCLLIPVIAFFCIAPVFYRPLSFGVRCSGEYLERNAEHVNQTRANMELCRFLEENGQGVPVVAPWPIVQMLTMPELGYVTKPLPQVYSGRVPFYAPVRKLTQPYDSMPEGTLFVYQENDFEKTGMSNPPLNPPAKNETLFQAGGIRGFTLVYRRLKR